MSTVNSTLLTASASLFPIASLASLGLATPLLGALAGLTSFLRFTVIEPKLDRKAFKPMTSSLMDIYNPEFVPKKVLAFSRLSKLKSALTNAKNSLLSFTTMGDRVLLSAARLLDIFSFFKGLYNRTFENFVSRILSEPKNSVDQFNQANIQLQLMLELAHELEQFQTDKKQALQQRFHVSVTTPHNQDISTSHDEVNTDSIEQINQVVHHLFRISSLRQAVNDFSKTLARLNSENALTSRGDLIERKMLQLQKRFITILEPKYMEKIGTNEKKTGYYFIKSLNQTYNLVKALRINLLHIRTEEMRLKTLNQTEAISALRLHRPLNATSIRKNLNPIAHLDRIFRRN